MNGTVKSMSTCGLTWLDGAVLISELPDKPLVTATVSVTL